MAMHPGKHLTKFQGNQVETYRYMPTYVSNVGSNDLRTTTGDTLAPGAGVYTVVNTSGFCPTKMDDFHAACDASHKQSCQRLRKSRGDVAECGHFFSNVGSTDLRTTKGDKLAPGGGLYTVCDTTRLFPTKMGDFYRILCIPQAIPPRFKEI